MQHYSENVAMKRYMKMLGQANPFYLNPNYNLEELCKDLKTNRAYASRFVNQTLQTSLPQLLRTLRLAYAERLMHNYPDMKIVDVARNSGFNNTVSLRRVFHDRKGMTPKELRAQQSETE